jgi:hypothetical protein
MCVCVGEEVGELYILMYTYTYMYIHIERETHTQIHWWERVGRWGRYTLMYAFFFYKSERDVGKFMGTPICSIV